MCYVTNAGPRVYVLVNPAISTGYGYWDLRRHCRHLHNLYYSFFDKVWCFPYYL